MQAAPDPWLIKYKQQMLLLEQPSWLWPRICMSTLSPALAWPRPSSLSLSSHLSRSLPLSLDASAPLQHLLVRPIKLD